MISELVHGVAAGWHGLGNETKAAIIGAAATLLAAFAGFTAVVLQMRSQGRQARATVIETEQRKLRAGMYEEAVSACRNVADAAIDLSTMLRTMALYLELASRAEAAGLGFQTPPTRFPALTAAYATFSDAVLRLIFLIENRRIVDPRILIFRTAFSTVLHDTRDMVFSKFVVNVMPVLPTEGPDGMLYPYGPPSIEGAIAVGALANKLINSLDDAVSCTDDFLVEMQNRLLGDLFGTQLTHREPLDPASKVIRLDQSDGLEAWFRQETDWGRACERAESETRARLAGATIRV